MKKVRIMLTAIAVLSVVGGALAFKSKTSTLFCETTQASVCHTSFAATFTPNNNPIGSFFCTTVQDDPCGSSQTIYQSN